MYFAFRNHQSVVLFAHVTALTMLSFIFQELKQTMKLILIAMAALAVAGYALFFGYLAYAKASYEFGDPKPLTSAEIDVLEARTEKRLEAGDYGLVEHTYWVDLFAQSFYAYGRANRYDRHPSEESRKALVKVLERTYANIDTVQKATMRNV